MLTDDADIAAWQNEGLPADRMSTENATILTSCQRWPLIVDPQLQGIKWIKNKYGEELRVIRMGQRGWDISQSNSQLFIGGCYYCLFIYLFIFFFLVMVILTCCHRQLPGWSRESPRSRRCGPHREHRGDPGSSPGASAGKRDHQEGKVRLRVRSVHAGLWCFSCSFCYTERLTRLKEDFDRD